MIKVVPYSYGLEDEAEKDAMYVGIEEMSITYVQEPDTCSSSDEYQYLTIKTQCGWSPSKEDADKEKCFYFNISIPEGSHWSVCEGEDLKVLIDDFKKRIYLKDETNRK